MTARRARGARPRSGSTTTRGRASTRPTRSAQRLAAHRYLADDAIATRRLPRRPTHQAGPRRGPGGHRQDPARQDRRRRARRAADPPAVLRGARRVQGPLRVELPQAAAAHPGGSGAAGTGTDDWHELEEDIFGDEFLLTRPLLEAIRATEPVVLLIDEVDRVEVETEALLLEILSEYQVSIPELGTRARRRSCPMVFLTSNNTRELSEALKRRCLYLHIGYPTSSASARIVLSRVPGHLGRPGRADRRGRALAARRSTCARRRRSPRRSTGRARSSSSAAPSSATRTSPRRCTSCSSTSPTSTRPPRSCSANRA